MRRTRSRKTLKAFYEYHSILMEPWDGPAALLFSDGRYGGWDARPQRSAPGSLPDYKEGHEVVASEVGVMDFEPGEIDRRRRLQPGKILLVDTKNVKYTTMGS